ncbi:MAG TPA: carboxypeptidase regulatory-like domain-containing protein, partial [Rhodocyclaceae bacterium]|nr:carboxypeptidase regulatory-like domain-containing protein [Rhodocyclaceae bacterium]
ARGALTLTAPDAVALYGPVSITLDLPAVRTARDALAIGSALLARRAQPMWSIELTVPDRLALAPGDTVTLAHPRVPQGAALVLSTAHDRARGTRTLSVELPAGTAPRIELTRRASAIDAAVNRDTVTYRDGVASFTVTDDNGAPLAGASVTLDGIETRETDRFGQVQFRTPRGAHTLTVVARGFAAFTLEVIV